MGCLFDYPLNPFICDELNDWNCVECPNWIDESEDEDSQSQAESEEV